MARRAALIVLGVGAPLVVVSFFFRHPAAAAAFALVAAAYPVALIALAASRGGRLGPLGPPLLALLVLLGGGLGALLVLRGRDPGSLWLGGLPPAAAILLYGLVLLPLALVVLTYALSFDRWGLRAADLERLRRAGRRPGGAADDGEATG